jgi:hypothetical protein
MRLWDNALYGAIAPSVPGGESPAQDAYSRPINRYLFAGNRIQRELPLERTFLKL